MRRQLVVPTVLAVMAPFALAACGGGGNPRAAVVAAATKTLSLTAVSNLAVSGGTMFAAPVLGEGEFAFATGLGYQAVDLPRTSSAQAGREYLLYLPGSLYVEPIHASLPGGRRWVRLSAAGAASAGAAMSGAVARAEALDPQLLLDEIVSGTVAAASSGTVVVDHVPLSKYVVTVSLTRALATVSDPRAGAARAALEQEAAAERSLAHAGSVRITVWVDVAGRVVMLEAALPGAGFGSVTITLSAFGTPISSRPNLPLAEQVVDLAALTPAARAQALAPWAG